MVVAVILDFLTVLNVLLSFSGLVSEPMDEDRMFSRSSSSPVLRILFRFSMSRM